MSLLNRLRAWRRRRQIRQFRKWMRVNHICWDGARRSEDFRDSLTFFWRANR